MKTKQTLIDGLLLLATVVSAAANDSVQRGSAASAGASVLAASTAGWVVYKGSEFTVKAVEASGDGVSLVLRGASDGVETLAKISADAARAGSVAVGTSVRVVAES